MFGFFKENKAVQAVINERYDAVFYAEGAADHQYLAHLLQGVREKGAKTCYISSDAGDPLLQMQAPDFHAVYSKSTLAFLLPRLQASVVVMTMPDLQHFLFKRSPAVKKYVYVFHALVSTHQQYRAHAFDHYDAIFCAGPHHEKEIREAEALYGLPSKELVPYGYPLLQALKQKAASIAGQKNRVLIAPSWYDEGILQTCIGEIAAVLGSTPYEVVIRPHREFVKRNRKGFERLQKTISRFSNIRFDAQPMLWDSLLSSQYLITDRSGIAFEFAFTRTQPVIFIDTPPKLQNPQAARFAQQPVEDRLRSHIGVQVPVTGLAALPALLASMEEKKTALMASIKAAEKEVVFDAAHLQQGIDYICAQLR